MNVLELEAVGRCFGIQPVLRSLDLSIAAGEIAVLVGASGSGKTTLLRIVAGLERAQTGTVRLRGSVVDGPARRFVPPERRGLGMVFQEHALWPHLTAAENVALAVPQGARDPAGIARALLDDVALSGLADRRPATLSGGQQQRVALARALATGSDLVLLDEPLSSLDDAVRDRLRPLIRDRLRCAGRAALLVSHDRTDAWRMADRLLVLEAGTLSQAGPPEQLYAAPATMAVARTMGAEGYLPVRGDGRGAVRTNDGHRLVARSTLADGQPGMALAHPAGIGLAATGTPAIKLDTMFEAGWWRTRWRIGDGELVGRHHAPPPDTAMLAIDPAALFAFPDATPPLLRSARSP